MSKNRNPDDIPSRDDVVRYLSDVLPAKMLMRTGSWADALAGLRWKWIQPLAEMSVASGVHPAAALAMTVAYSKDEQFVAEARQQINRLPGPA